jgi:uncharacterized protein YukE
MTRINVDIEKLRTWISDFDRCVQDYRTSVDSFFKNINRYTGWKGEAAVTYLESVNTESIKYVNFGDNLLTFSTTLSGIVDNLESTLVSTAKE